MEDEVADSDSVYAAFVPEQDYALLGIDGPPPSLQGDGCFHAESVDIMVPGVDGQSAGCLHQPGPKDVQHTVALVVTVASEQQMSESTRGTKPAEQRDETMGCADNQPAGAVTHVEGLCCSHKCDESFEDQERLSDHLRLHTKRPRSPGSGDQARPRAKRPRSARCKRGAAGAGLEGETDEGSSSATGRPWMEDPCPVRGGGDGLSGAAAGPPADGSGIAAASCPHGSCGLTFRTAAGLADRRCVHLPFRCDRCDVACPSATLLAQHKRHGRAKTKTSSCDLCPFHSCAPRDLSKHYSTMHRDKAAYTCNRCDFVCRYRKVLKKHLTAHSDESGSTAEENDEQVERGQEELDGGNVKAQTRAGKQQPSACDEEEPVSETGSEGDRNRKNNSLRQRHFKVDVQEGMEHLYKTHICPECKRCFKKRTHLVEHLHLHFPDPSLQCPHCQKFFTSKGKLKVHLMRELGEKAHHCPLCDYRAVEKNSLNRHMASMHENTSNFYSEVYCCPACEERFTVSNALKEHMKSHKEERRPLGCSESGCDYTAQERKDFVRHLQEEHGSRAVECRYRTCGSLFATEAGMEAHRRTHYAFHCDQCDFVCSNKHVFRRHKRRGHPGSEELPCAFCPYSTFNPVEFNDHVGKMHANEKIHKCGECDFATAHKRVLNRHVLLHTGEKPHQCELCDFTCRDMGYLSKHMLTHSDDKNYMCTECGYITKWKHYLTVHMRKHTGDLRYHCNQCSYRCHRADQLSSHKLRHQGKSLICEVCGFACKRKYELQKHMQVKHSQDYQMPLHQCRYCSYQTQYKQALLNHENCKHTKQKEFRCALCPYKTFSNTGLFFHKRKVHGYVPGDKEWLENYAKEEMAMNSTHNVLSYIEANANPSSAAKTGATAASTRSEAWRGKGSGAGEELVKKACRPGSEAAAFGQAGVASDADTAGTGQAMAAQTAEHGSDAIHGTEQELQVGLCANDPPPEVVFSPQAGFPHPPAPDEPAKHIPSHSLDCWPLCSAASMYGDFGLGTAEDLSHDETDVGEHCDDGEGGEGEHLVGNHEVVGHNVDVFTDEDRQLSEQAGELGQEAEDTPALGSCTSPVHPQPPPPEPPDPRATGWDLPSPESREEALLSRSESEIKALRRQDKQQAQALVLEGRVQMLVVQTDARLFRCEDCSYVTRKEKAMVLHTKSGCQSRKTPLVCPACGASFKQQRGLNTHTLKKCPVRVKKGRLFPRPAVAIEPPAALFHGHLDSDSKAAGPRGSSTGTGQQADAGRHEEHEPHPHPDPDQPAQPTSDTSEACAAGEPAQGEDCQPGQAAVDGNTLLEGPAVHHSETDVSSTLEEEALEAASLGNGETLLPSSGLGSSVGAGAGFTVAQDTYSCTACPFTCSSELAMGEHVSAGCARPAKLPCGLCPLLFRSDRALRNHRAIKHRGEGAAAGGGAHSGLGSGGEAEEGGDGAGRQRRITCSSCPFTCCQQRAMDTHLRKGCMKADELQCRLCSFVCKSAGALRQHALLHGCKGARRRGAAARRSRLCCQLCPFSCKQARCLQQHVALKHHGAKPHKCSYCDFSTARRYRLEAHESLHTGVGRLACDACQRTFGTGSKLRVHKLRRLQPQRHQPARGQLPRRAAQRRLQSPRLQRPLQLGGRAETAPAAQTPPGAGRLPLLPLLPVRLPQRGHAAQPPAEAAPAAAVPVLQADLPRQAAAGGAQEDALPPPLPALPLRRARAATAGAAPAGPARAGGRRAQAPALPLLRLRLPPPAGVRPPHEGTRRHTPLQVYRLRLHHQEPPEDHLAHPHSHRREALQVPPLQLRLCRPLPTQVPHAYSPRGEEIPVSGLWLQMQVDQPTQVPHDQAHRCQALPVRPVRLPYQPGGRPADPQGDAAQGGTELHLRAVWQRVQDPLPPEDPPEEAQRGQAPRVRGVPPGLPLAGWPAPPLPHPHQRVPVLLPPLQLQGQAEVPGGETHPAPPPPESRGPQPGGGQGAPRPRPGLPSPRHRGTPARRPAPRICGHRNRGHLRRTLTFPNRWDCPPPPKLPTI